jgi:hypothetical protein
MIRTDSPEEYKIRPPRRIRTEDDSTAPSFQLVQAFAGRFRRAAKRNSKPKPKPSASFSQRCAVRVTYSRNSSRNVWLAHGKYLQRESSQHAPGEPMEPHELPASLRGFDQTHDAGIHISSTLSGWQEAGDLRLWKLIISPENSCDLVELTRRTMAGLERELGKLEWVAIVHRDKEHHHVHVALRGVAEHGQALMMPQELVRRGIRGFAEKEVTRQLGYRTPEQARQAKLNEVNAARFTSIDRMIQVHARGEDQISVGDIPEAQRELVVRRIKALEGFDLAAPGVQPGTWRIEPRFDGVLKAMQRTADRQRLLRDHGAPVSDASLPFSASAWQRLEGRVLVHGEDEGTQRPYMILEGTDAKLHYVETSNFDIQTSRSVGKLKVNSFVRLRRHGRSSVDVQDLGNARQLLDKPEYFRTAAREMRVRPAVTSGGWLGDYQTRLLAAAVETLTHSRQQPPSR